MRNGSNRQYHKLEAVKIIKMKAMKESKEL